MTLKSPNGLRGHPPFFVVTEGLPCSSWIKSKTLRFRMLHLILNYAPCHPERPALSSSTTRQVILNLIQDLFFASLDSGSSPDDWDKRAQIPGQARMTGINKPRLLVKPG